MLYGKLLLRVKKKFKLNFNFFLSKYDLILVDTIIGEKYNIKQRSQDLCNNNNLENGTP